MVEENDVFGDAVNIASRLQALAPIGCIWVSEAVHRNISNKKDINTVFIKEEKLKNVREPVRIYEVRAEGAMSYSANTVQDFKKRNILSSKRKKIIFGTSTPEFKKLRQKIYERNELFKADLFAAIKRINK